MKTFTNLRLLLVLILVSTGVLVAQAQKTAPSVKAPAVYKTAVNSKQLELLKEQGIDPQTISEGENQVTADEAAFNYGLPYIATTEKESENMVKEFKETLSQEENVSQQSLSEEEFDAMADEMLSQGYTDTKEFLAAQEQSFGNDNVVFSPKVIYNTDASGTVTLGTDATYNTTLVHPTPYGTYYKNHRVQYLILSSELSGLGMLPGNITALGFNVQNMNTCSAMPNYTMKIKGTAATALTTTFDNGTYTTVWTNPSFLPLVGWNTHTFSTPFYWNGVDNVLIDICFDLITTYTQNASVYYTATTGTNTALYYRNDTQIACGTANAGTISVNRANMQITGEVANCLPPSGLTASNITTTTADLSWTPMGSELLWDLEWGPSGFTPGTGIVISGLSSPSFALSGLSALTSYDYYIQADCGAGSLSSLAGPKTFQTLANPISGTYTINSTLPTGSTNFNNFTDFATALNQGGLAGPVTANVVTGTGPYTEQIILGVINNSSSTNTVTINGNGETLQYLSTNTSERATLKLDGSDYFIIDNLVVVELGSLTSPTEYGWAVWLTNNADFNTFTNCQFIATQAATSSNFAAFVAANSSSTPSTTGLAVSNLTVNGCITSGGYYGMSIQGPSTSPWAQNNTITNNEIKDFYYYGLYLKGMNNSLISGNEISRPNRTSVSAGYMMYLYYDFTGTEITKNKIFAIAGNGGTTSSAYGIYSLSLGAAVGDELFIANNVISGFANMNGTNYGIYLSTTGTSGFKVYHNTVSVDNATHTGSSTVYSFYGSGSTSTFDIRNNIFAYTTNSTGTKYCLYFSSGTFTSNYNVLYRGATAGTNNTGYWGVAFATLANWQTANGGIYDLNSVADDPLFVNPSIGNLKPASPAVNNIGTNLLSVVPDDINGIARTATPDPGAYEFSPPACLPPTLLPVTTLTSSSADLGWTENGTATTWDIEVVLSGSPATGTPTASGVTTNPYTYGGLNPSTTYDFYVRAVCSAFSSSSWSGPGTFTTSCVALTELSENFDGISTPNFPPCWAKVGTTGSAYTQTSNPNSAPNCLYMYSTSTSSIAMVSLPELSNAGAGTHWLRFMGRANVTIGGIIEVGYLTDPLNQATFTAVQSITMASFTYEQYFANLGTAPGANTYLAFRHTGSPANSLLIDDVVWEVKPACPDPIGLTATNVTGNSVDISWTSFSGVSNVEYGFSGFTVGVDPQGTLTGVTSPQTLNSLDPSTMYEFYVQDDCGTDAISNWVGPVSFTTLSPSGELLSTLDLETICSTTRIIASEFFPGTGTLFVTASTDALAGGDYIYEVNPYTGALLNSYLQISNSVWGMRDMANDGNYLYAGDEGGFYQIDPTDGTQTLLFDNTAPVFVSGLGVNPIRALARNPVNGHFFTKSFSTPLYEFDAAGNLINTFTFTTPNPSAYGAGWNPNTGMLWLHSSTVFSSEINEFVEVNPATGVLTGVAIGVPDQPCTITPIVGGGFLDFGNMYPGRNILGATLQATPDVLHIVEFNDTGFPDQSSNFSPYCGELDIPLAGNLTWDFGANTDTYDLWFGPTGAMVQVVTGAPASTGSYTYSGILGSSAYEWMVIEHNTTGTTTGMLYSFTTVCGTAPAPFFEDFENAGLVPSCWANTSSNGDIWKFSTVNGTNHTAPYDHTSGTGYFAWVDDSQNTPLTIDATLTTPYIDVSSLTSPQLDFWLYSDNEGYTNMTLRINVWDGAAWNNDFAVFTGNTAGWENKVVMLSTLTITGDIQIQFVGDETSAGTGFYDDIAIDDIAVGEAPSCPDPAFLGVSNVTAISADLTWTSYSGLSDIEFGLAGFGPTGTPTDPDVTSPYNVGSLNNYTAYDFYVRDNCGAGDFSGWVGPYTLYTLPGAHTLPVVEDFESGFSYFDNAPGNGTDWVSNTSYYHNGVQCAHNAYAVSNSNIMHETGILDLSGAPDAVLEFWQIAKTEGNYDHCIVEVSIDGGLNYTPLPLLTYTGTGNYHVPTANAPYDICFDEDSYAIWGTGSEIPDNTTWWQKESFNLSDYLTTNVRIRFRLDSDASINRFGWLVDDISIYVPSTISGTITYANVAMTPLNNCTVELYDASDAFITAYISDLSGFYEFNGLVDGTYTLKTTCANPYSYSTNVGDLNVVINHVLGTPLTGLYFLAGEVSGDAIVDVADVNLMINNILGLTVGYPAVPAWVFENQTISVSGGIFTIDYQGLQASDTDGSW